MTYQTIRVRKLTPRIGAQISGVDLAKPLDDRTFREIKSALLENQVIFFRDQDITLDQHKDFGRRFGELHVHPAAPSPEGHPEILRIHADEKSKRVAGEGWQHPAPAQGPLVRRRHAVLEHVRRLRCAVPADEGHAVRADGRALR